jgi:hypothetical protein
VSKCSSRTTLGLTHLDNSVNCVRWCAESMRPPNIVDDTGFHVLMKTGRPHHRLPTSQTVRRDTHVVFKAAKERIVQLLEVSLLQ